MLAAFVSTPAPKDPLSVLEVGERPEPEVPDGWTTVQVKAVSLNHHDLFSLRGVGLPEERMPMILGTDAPKLFTLGSEWSGASMLHVRFDNGAASFLPATRIVIWGKK